MYDAIVVGARCAGSPTAMLLARKGYRVLLVDRATFPSDSMHNHYIRLLGVSHLRRWGLLERVAATGCPPVHRSISNFGDFPLTQPFEPTYGEDAEYGPRRIVLDKILVDAAAEAGAEVREGFSVSEVIVEDGVVRGIVGKGKGGSTVTERARIVIGADGHRSLVAKTVDAPTYNVRPKYTCGYYSYWSDMPCDALEVTFMPHPVFMLAFPTNFGQTCVAVQAPTGEFATFKRDVEGNFAKMLDLAPELASRVREGRREEKFYGTADLTNFFRKPYGPGWALVGDAGYHKDPILALGISDAFRDAQFLADAIDAGFSGREPLEQALAGYEQRRNEVAVPEYEDNCFTASFGPFPPQLYAGRARARAAQLAAKG